MDLTTNQYNTIYNALYLAYPRARETLSEDISDAYFNIVSKNKQIRNLQSYIAQFIYNRHYHFTKNDDKVDYLEDLLYQEFDDPYSSDDPYEADSYILQQAYDSLALDEKSLYKMYFIEGLTGREIAKQFNIHQNVTYLKLKEIKIKLKQFCTELSENAHQEN